MYLFLVGTALLSPLTGCHTTRPNACGTSACGPAGCGGNACGNKNCGDPTCLDHITTGRCDCANYNPLDPYNKCGVNRPPHLATRQAGAAAGYPVGVGTTGTPITGVLPQQVSPHPVLGSPSPPPMVPGMTPEMIRESPREFPRREN